MMRAGIQNISHILEPGSILCFAAMYSTTKRCTPQRRAVLNNEEMYSITKIAQKPQGMALLSNAGKLQIAHQEWPYVVITVVRYSASYLHKT